MDLGNEFDAVYDLAKLPYVICDQVARLDEATRQRVACAPPGSTRVQPLGAGWLACWIGDTYIGDVHLSALARISRRVLCGSEL